MKLIKEITDKDIIHSEGRTNAIPRYTSRAILFNNMSQFAVMYSPKFKLYSLPGGGIEEEEDKEDAVKREILEETGYHCEIVNELGYVYENRAYCDFTQYSYYYIARTVGKQKQISMDECERESEMEVQWHTLEKVIQLIVTPVHDTVQRKFIQAKDKAALYEYVQSIGSNNILYFIEG